VSPASRDQSAHEPLSLLARPMSATPLQYVALGDSYTIGTSVEETERWPNQLVAAVGSNVLELKANLAVTGYTSRDVIEFQLPQLEQLRPDFATLLIGVNDVVQGIPAERYHLNLRVIFDVLLWHARADRVLVVTTPDYTATPHGADYGDPAAQRAGILRTNRLITETARGRGVRVVDIFDISSRAEHDAALVAADGLHPSGRQYALWVERIAPAVSALLERTA